MQNAKGKRQNVGRLRLIPLTLYAGGETPPLRVSLIPHRRGGVAPPESRSFVSFSKMSEGFALFRLRFIIRISTEISIQSSVLIFTFLNARAEPLLKLHIFGIREGKLCSVIT